MATSGGREVSGTKAKARTNTCTCRPKSYVIATFRGGDLVEVVRMHNRANKYGVGWCGLPPERLNRDDWRGGNTGARQ